MFLYFLTVSHIEEDKQGRNANGGPHNGLMLSYLFFPDYSLSLLLRSGGGKRGQERLAQLRDIARPERMTR